MTKALIVDAREEDSCDVGGLSVRWKVDGNQTVGRFSVVHHPIAPHALGAPLHDHHHEDELCYALEMRCERVPDLCQRFGLTFPAL